MDSTSTAQHQPQAYSVLAAPPLSPTERHELAAIDLTEAQALLYRKKAEFWENAAGLLVWLLWIVIGSVGSAGVVVGLALLKG